MEGYASSGWIWVNGECTEGKEKKKKKEVEIALKRAVLKA
jgi:hypothetical protein